jgi:hypothetical protein
MDHMLSRAEGQRVRYVREWRSVDVHQPSASSLRMLAGALLLMSLALGVLALIVIAALPLLVLGALAWTARPWLRRAPRIGRRKVPTDRLRPARPSVRPVGQARAPAART